MPAFHNALAQTWAALRMVDLSLPLSEEYPLNWPTLPGFRKSVLNWFEPYTDVNGGRQVSRGFYDQWLHLDEHTGTHIDMPAHCLPPAELATLQAERQSAPLNVFAGPCCVLDVTRFLDAAAPGHSPHIPVAAVEAWELQHGEIGAGEVVLFDTGYTTRYFQAMPEGRRFLHEPVLLKNCPGWPVPETAVFDHLERRGVRHVGLSSPSVGALEDGSVAHRAGIRAGITFAENLIRLEQLPARGAIYLGLPLAIAQSSGSPVRAVAMVPTEELQDAIS